ncbi:MULTISPECIES: L-serine ammonia-lyase [unclassified Rathayibacter]|uniref:L-serine ammonia-lyase n=1 Tax=unclassified Rathayibacter TaxID=2609250 RepID=UPI00188AE116|nr:MULTISPECIES: L-serine ammonia-lyase [unclassified Rathayibacter]MBF4462823.1 L-serine ammonia-lyase [Rathayibacter sp. VKM Ac-2879]MBF4504237.1 L-serine ammonia-lyase [Rathayibacter sp. VKM Ac-2878]
MSAYVSVVDLFSVGIGPSSSHTVGPMRAALAFAERIKADGLLGRVSRIGCVLYGSLGSTGIGHGTPDAVVAGLSGLDPESCDPALVGGAWRRLEEVGAIALAGEQPLAMTRDDIAFEPRTRLPEHPNALTFHMWLDGEATPAQEDTFFSIGGGFIRRAGEQADLAGLAPHPYPFVSAADLLAVCARTGATIADISAANERALHPDSDLDAQLDRIWNAMAACVERGLETEGVLPGGLGVRRRASLLRKRLEAFEEDPLDRARVTSVEWLHAFALAVNEENAAGGRVVTAPTNGAAGIIPAVGHHYLRFVPGADREGLRTFLLTATAIGSLFTTNASISGAEAGCQGEVGSACAMAAGALCAVLGGTPQQVENAAEIAMEHHLGLTCDPVGGLVQIPCIERNAIAASTAVSAARLALHGDGTHRVSLDAVIETMRQTGVDMSSKYKETSEGGLAVNVIEC